MLPQNDIAPARAQTIRRVKRIGLIAAGVAILIVANGIAVRLAASNDQKSWADEQAVSNVVIVHPKLSSGGNTLTLPGSLQAYYTAPIYSRVPGYVKTWEKDIGARVKKGELLAEIDTPELDQQIAQARAELANADAARQVSQSTADRWANLLRIQAVSKQDAEEKAGDLAVKTALVKSAQANLDRLLTMKTFARITAPFDGVVTERAIDIGALVNAGVGSAGSSLFTIADTHMMRVYVHVPQNYSAQIRDNLDASLTLPEYPGQTFKAKLVSTSSAISDQSNTLLVQLEATNARGLLKPGAYAQVSLNLPDAGKNLTIPVSALLFRSDGLLVAVVGNDNKVALKPVTIATDLGTEVEINSGLSASDRVIDSPPDSLLSGDAVHVTDSVNPAS